MDIFGEGGRPMERRENGPIVVSVDLAASSAPPPPPHPRRMAIWVRLFRSSKCSLSPMQQSAADV